MEVVQSFTIDHTHLKPGIYVSRIDKGFTTFDLRITEPNKEPAVAPSAIHSLEHLMATWFRNSEVKEDVVYVGPMGCLTGMYIIMTGSYSTRKRNSRYNSDIARNNAIYARKYNVQTICNSIQI